MSRSLLLVLLIYGLVLAGLITLRGELLVLALPLLLYLGASLVYRPRAVHLSVDRKIDASRVIEGQPVRVTLSITNLGAPLENLQIGEVIPSGLRVIEGETRVVGGGGAPRRGGGGGKKRRGGGGGGGLGFGGFLGG
ncbi:MAG: hypothetical protein OXM87_13945, partial [Truepera sp.]|nr:hypothetical protein [Truepera sp.]